MKKLSIIWLFIFVSFFSTQSLAYEHFIFRTDFLESGNPGGWEYSLKTFNEEYSVNIGSITEVDIWAYHIPLPETGLIYGYIGLYYDPSQISILSVEIYGPSGPWNPEQGYTIPDYNGPGTYLLSPANFHCVYPDNDGDVIVAKIRFLSEGSGDTVITIGQPEGVFDPTFYGCDTTTQYWGDHHPITIHQIIIDSDDDGTPDHEDNCPLIPNGPNLGICRDGEGVGTSCTSDEDCGTSFGECYLNQEEAACNCVANFDCDYDVDGGDAAHFKTYFGNGPYKNPCDLYPCDGDFDCDCDVDGSDTARFKQNFGSAFFCSADYSASCYNPCLSCVDGIYAYTCSYE